MLYTYEHNITVQSLFAMLPPLVCDKPPTVTTVGMSCSDSQPWVCDKPGTPSSALTAGDLLCRKSDTTSESEGPSWALAADDLLCRKTDTTSESEGPLSALAADDLLCHKSDTTSESEGPLSALTAGDLLCHKSDTTSESEGPLSALTAGDLLCRKSDTTSESEGPSSALSADDLLCRKSDTTCYSSKSEGPSSTLAADDLLCHKSDTTLESEGPSSALAADDLLCSNESLAGNTQLAADVDSISLDAAHSTGIQTLDTPHTLLLTSSATDVALTSESGAACSSELTEKVDRRCQHDLTETFRDMKSDYKQDETVSDEQKYLDRERLRRLTTDNSQCPVADVASVGNDDRCLGVTLRHDCAVTVVDKGQEDEPYNADDNVDRGRTAELCCKTDTLSASTDAQLVSEVPVDHVVSNVSLQTPPHSWDIDCLAVNETAVENIESYCHNAPRAAELLYWAQRDGDVELAAESREGSIVDITASDTAAATSAVAEQSVSGTEPKPQRMQAHSSQKKHISSLMESILAGKEWVIECGREWNPSENSSLADGEPCCAGADDSHEERRLDLCERLTNATQTEPDDFMTLTKIISNDEVLDTTNYVAVVETSPRVISSPCIGSQTSPKLSLRTMLHKSCSTADEAEDVDNSSQLDFLASCFPSISLQDLQELMENCGNDTVVAAHLLFEFGYEYNVPQDDVTDIRSSSTSCTDSAVSSPDQSVVVENSSPSTRVSRSKRNASAPYRMYRDAVLPKGVTLESRKMCSPCEEQVPANSPASSLYLLMLVVFSHTLLTLCADILYSI